MTHLTTTDDLFFTQAGLDRTRLETLVADALKGADDGELYLEYCESESLVWDDGRIKSATYDSSQGFGLRSVAGEATGFAHAASLDEKAILRAVPTVRSVLAGYSGSLAASPIGTNRQLYSPLNPLKGHDTAQKAALLASIDAYARAKDTRVRQVSASIGLEWQAVQIMRPDGHRVADVRPMVRFSVQVIVGEGDKQETGVWSGGGRVALDKYMEPATWQNAVDEAVRQALVNLSAISSPAGEMTVVLGSGWPGILLHEAIGHGLEGDFNRKKTSVFSGLLGQRIASPGVTVVDDGTIANRRGSLTVDDEGTPSSCTTLIEDGILKGFMQDRLNARLMGMNPTGNGRRQSFAHLPLPRMTNTVMLSGSYAPEEIIASVKKGIYAANFGGGQVDIVSGKFVFSGSEAYLIEDGKIGPAIKGATIIGSGADALTRIKMVGNNSEMDQGTGTCGKAGQGVPVGVGQPTLRIDGLTVGGTSAA